jgi:hypothetical protein
MRAHAVWNQGWSLTLSVVAAACVGCSSTAGPSDASRDAASTDGEVDASDAIDVSPASDAPSVDAPSSSDAVTMADGPAPTDAGFACGSLTCDGATQYCQVLRARAADGGFEDEYRCDSFDIVCATDHTCGCLQRNLKCSTECNTDAGGVTTVCGF